MAARYGHQLAPYQPWGWGVFPPPEEFNQFRRELGLHEIRINYKTSFLLRLS
jgi:hypothetical protein